MDIVIYSKIENEHLASLQFEIENNLERSPLIVHEFGSLFDKLKEKVSSNLILVFLITTENELDCLSSCRSKMSPLSFILILPHGRSDIASRALQFQPRYLGYADDDFKDICSVLKKMISNKEVQNY